MNVSLEPQLLHGTVLSDASASRLSFSKSSEGCVVARCVRRCMKGYVDRVCQLPSRLVEVNGPGHDYTRIGKLGTGISIG